jgi:hypothetical protein
MIIKRQIYREVHGDQAEAVLALRKLAEKSEQVAQEALNKGNYGMAQQKYHIAALFLGRAMGRWPPVEVLRQIKEAQDFALKHEYLSSVLKGTRRN